MTFQTQVACNDSDLLLAIREGMRPMQEFFDRERGDLPFFENQMAPSEGFGNRHHETFSAAHIPGRWLLGLLHAEEITGIAPDPRAIEALRKWTFSCLGEAGIGFPACLDMETFRFKKVTHLHNLREVMHALYALCRWREDGEARGLALDLIRTVDRYFDYEKGCFLEEKYGEETGAEVRFLFSSASVKMPFPPNFGRYIGPLVKLYRATGETEALRQAIALKDVCLRDVLLEDGDYDAERFGGHTHSTTATVSSLAQLGDLLEDRALLDRADRFLQKGLKKIALPFGWCVENDWRWDNLVGEVNNTSDIMESCLILGRHGYAGYYAMAEEILRGHFLPSQLLDPSFIPEYEDPASPATYRLASRSVGAFGFPTPYGHEDREGAWISFNWDIVGGAVNGLCEAYRATAYADGDALTVPLHFACDRDFCTVTDPYAGDGTMTVTPKKPFRTLRLRVPRRAAVRCANQPYTLSGEWLYTSLENGPFTVTFDFETREETYDFRRAHIRLRWHGERVTGANNGDRRLSFFPSID